MDGALTGAGSLWPWRACSAIGGRRKRGHSIYFPLFLAFFHRTCPKECLPEPVSNFGSVEPKTVGFMAH